MQEQLLHIETQKQTENDSNSDLICELYGLGAGKYRTILIDPPWDIKFDLPWGQGKKKQYDTMSLEEIKALPISPHALSYLQEASVRAGMFGETKHPNPFNRFATRNKINIYKLKLAKMTK